MKDFAKLFLMNDMKKINQKNWKSKEDKNSTLFFSNYKSFCQINKYNQLCMRNVRTILA